MEWNRVVEKRFTTDDINANHKKGLDNMIMHGQLFWQQANLSLVDIEGGQKWLHSAHLLFEMESLICVAQE